MRFKEGDRVEVQWARLGWLGGTFVNYCSGGADEPFERCIVRMDNFFACDRGGYHPDCVRPEVPA